MGKLVRRERLAVQRSRATEAAAAANRAGAVAPTRRGGAAGVRALARHAGNAATARTVRELRPAPRGERRVARLMTSDDLAKSGDAGVRYRSLRAKAVKLDEAAKDLAAMSGCLRTAIERLAGLKPNDPTERDGLLKELRPEKRVVDWALRQHLDDPQRFARMVRAMAGVGTRALRAKRAETMWSDVLAQLERPHGRRTAEIASQQAKLDAFHARKARKLEGWEKYMGWWLHGHPTETRQTPAAGEIKVAAPQGPPRLGGPRPGENVKLGPPKQTHWEGWKLHVRTDPLLAGELLETLAPRLSGAVYKVAQSLEQYDTATGEARGKFLVVYPRTTAELLELVMTIDEGIDELHRKRKPGMAPPLRGDMPIGRSGGVFTRYGYFTGSGAPPDQQIAPGAREKAKLKAATMHGHDWFEFLVYDPSSKLFVFDDRAKLSSKRGQQLLGDLDGLLPVLWRSANEASGADKAVKVATLRQARDVMTRLGTTVEALEKAEKQNVKAEEVEDGGQGQRPDARGRRPVVVRV